MSVATAPPARVVAVLVTAPGREEAETLACALVEGRLAACVSLVPSITSVYRWEGEVRREEEVLLVIKTTDECVPALCDRVHELHPYDVPEVVALPVTAGSERYLAWVAGETRGGV
ncbi:MAG: divalent-cation tolerance protein CutA [Gemmatimonadota bacterium]|nr:divalent-cation tolerance protein CutA [Gemmatimonadota bacterium]